MRAWIVIVLVGLLAGCSLFRADTQECRKSAAYESAGEIPALQVPEGTDLPDTRNALRVPQIERTAPPRGGCLDTPPQYRSATTPPAG